LHPWLELGWLKCSVRNADQIGDVAGDFLRLVGVPVEGLVPIWKQNQTPSNEELLLRAIFNNQFADPVLPSEFDCYIRPGMLDKSVPSILPLGHYLPDEKDIMRFMESIADDAVAVNRILESCGQPPLDTTTPIQNDNRVELEKLVAVLLMRLVEVERRNNKGLIGLITKADRFWGKLKTRLADRRN